MFQQCRLRVLATVHSWSLPLPTPKFGPSKVAMHIQLHLYLRQRELLPK